MRKHDYFPFWPQSLVQGQISFPHSYQFLDPIVQFSILPHEIPSLFLLDRVCFLALSSQNNVLALSKAAWIRSTWFWPCVFPIPTPHTCYLIKIDYKKQFHYNYYSLARGKFILRLFIQQLLSQALIYMFKDTGKAHMNSGARSMVCLINLDVSRSEDLDNEQVFIPSWFSDFRVHHNHLEACWNTDCQAAFLDGARSFAFLISSPLMWLLMLFLGDHPLRTLVSSLGWLSNWFTSDYMWMLSNYLPPPGVSDVHPSPKQKVFLGGSYSWKVWQ